jgi:hypothetical protein
MNPVDLLATFVLPDDRRWGDAATAVQWADARAIFSDAPQRRHWLGRARGYAKTTDVAGMTLAALLTGLVRPEHPAYVAAGDQDQAALLRDSIEGFVNRTPGLGGRLTIGNWKVTANGGAELRVMSADGGSAFGIRPSWLVLDELCQFGDTRGARRLYEALVTSLAKIPDSRCIIITTAGTPTHWSHKVYDSATKNSDLWRVSMIDGPAPWTSTREIESDRLTLGDAAVERLYYNRFTIADDALLGTEELNDASVLQGPLPGVKGIDYRWGIDVGVVNDATVVCVCHAESANKDGVYLGQRVILDRIWTWKGTRRNPVNFADVEATITANWAEYPGMVNVDPSQARDLVQRLRAKDIPTHIFDFTSTSVGILASTLLRLFRSRLIWIPKDPELLAELGDVRLRENSVGTLRMDHVSGGHDDRAQALALACQSLNSGPKPAWIFTEDVSFVELANETLYVPHGNFAIHPDDAFAYPQDEDRDPDLPPRGTTQQSPWA